MLYAVTMTLSSATVGPLFSSGQRATRDAGRQRGVAAHADAGEVAQVHSQQVPLEADVELVDDVRGQPGRRPARDPEDEVPVVVGVAVPQLRTPLELAVGLVQRLDEAEPGPALPVGQVPAALGDDVGAERDVQQQDAASVEQ